MIAFTRTIAPGTTISVTGSALLAANNETEDQLIARIVSSGRFFKSLTRWQEGVLQFKDSKENGTLTDLNYLGAPGVLNALAGELITHSSFSAMQTLVNNLIDCLVSTKEMPNDPA